MIVVKLMGRYGTNTVSSLKSGLNKVACIVVYMRDWN